VNVLQILGAGIFVTTVVAGAINISTSFKMARRPFLRDIIFYLVAVTWTFVIIYRRDIKTVEATGSVPFFHRISESPFPKKKLESKNLIRF